MKVSYTSRRRRARLKLELIRAYGGSCVGCKEKDPCCLTIDHVLDNARTDPLNPGRRGGSNFYAALKKAGYPQYGYQLLCASCQMRKVYWGPDSRLWTTENARKALKTRP